MEAFSSVLKTKREQFRSQTRRFRTANLFSDRRKPTMEEITIFNFDDDFIVYKIALSEIRKVHEKNLETLETQEMSEKIENFLNLTQNKKPTKLTQNQIEDLKVFETFDLVYSTEKYSKDHQLFFNLLWSMGIIVALQKFEFDFIKNNGFADKILKLLTNKEQNERIISMSCYVLANLCADCPDIRDYYLDNGILDSLKGIMARGELEGSTVDELVYLSCNLLNRPYPDYNTVGLTLLPLIAIALLTSHDRLVEDSLWALTYLSDGDDERIENILKLNLLKKIMEHAQSGKIRYSLPAVRIIANLLTGTDDHTETLIEEGVFNLISHHFENTKNSAIILDNLWCLSNIVVNHVFIADFFAHKIHNTFFEMIETVDDDCKGEISFILFNISKAGTQEQIEKLINQNLPSTLKFLLNENNQRTIKFSLKTLKTVLHKIRLSGEEELINKFIKELVDNKIDDLLFDLQINPNEEISNLADRVAGLMKEESDSEI